MRVEKRKRNAKTSSPVEECGHIFGKLRQRVRSAIVVLNCAVHERGSHANNTAREVRVVVLVVTDSDASGGIFVASEK